MPMSLNLRDDHPIVAIVENLFHAMVQSHHLLVIII